MISQHFKILLLSILSIALTYTPAQAGIGKGYHVNIVSFQKDDEIKGAAKYPATFTGSFSQLISLMDGKADPLLMVHTPHIHSGDVVNIQVDVLGHGRTGLEDDGMNCSLSYSEKNSTASIGGLCNILVATHNGVQKQKIIIPPKTMLAGSGNNATWVLIFLDEKTEVAFYANIEK